MFNPYIDYTNWSNNSVRVEMTKNELNQTNKEALQFRHEFIETHHITSQKFTELINKVDTYLDINIPKIKLDLTEYNNTWEAYELYQQYKKCVDLYTHSSQDCIVDFDEEESNTYYVGCPYERYLEEFKLALSSSLQQYGGTTPTLIPEDEYNSINFDEIAKVDMKQINIDKKKHYSEIVKENVKDNAMLVERRIENILLELEMSQKELNKFKYYRPFLLLPKLEY